MQVVADAEYMKLVDVLMHLLICSNNVSAYNRPYWLHHMFIFSSTLQWRHNERDGVSNRQPPDFLLNRLFRHRSKKTWKLRDTGLCEGNSPVTVNCPYKGPVTRKMFLLDDVIMKPYLNVFSVIWNMYRERILEREKEDIEFAIF